MGGAKKAGKMSRKAPATAIIILGKIYHPSIKVLMVVCVLLTWMIHKSMIRIVCIHELLFFIYRIFGYVNFFLFFFLFLLRNVCTEFFSDFLLSHQSLNVIYHNILFTALLIRLKLVRYPKFFSFVFIFV